jgi:hypothetical protein
MSPVKIELKHKQVMHPKNLSPVMKADRVNPLRPHGNNSDIKP